MAGAKPDSGSACWSPGTKVVAPVRLRECLPTTGRRTIAALKRTPSMQPLCSLRGVALRASMIFCSRRTVKCVGVFRLAEQPKPGLPPRNGDRPGLVPRSAADCCRTVQLTSPNSLAISIRWTSLVPSPISRIFASRHMRATEYSFMKP